MRYCTERSVTVITVMVKTISEWGIVSFHVNAEHCGFWDKG
ncbi:hypothetical protein [Bifidobacterium fermentum]|uniref:Uncharacterized protein n=1 Tax=Bifidobacterium fermentum TaxID=3059035 RepID=A0AB39UAS4_9BIFI